MVIGAQEPFTVPAGVKNRFLHIGDRFLCNRCLVIHASVTADCRIVFSVAHEHAGDKDGLGIRTFGRTERLERFSRFGGEAVQIQTVIPVSAAD